MSVRFTHSNWYCATHPYLSPHRFSPKDSGKWNTNRGYECWCGSYTTKNNIRKTRAALRQEYSTHRRVPSSLRIMAEGFVPIEFTTGLKLSDVQPGQGKRLWLFRVPRHITTQSLEVISVLYVATHFCVKHITYGTTQYNSLTVSAAVLCSRVCLSLLSSYLAGMKTSLLE